MDACSPEELGELVPRSRDVRYDRLVAAGLALGVRQTAVLMELALTENGLHPDPAARLPVYGGTRADRGDARGAGGRGDTGDRGDAGEHGDAGMLVLRPEQVAAAFTFLRDSALGELVRQQDTVLARRVAQLGSEPPWSESWAARVVHDLRELRDFFAVAAAAGDAIIVRESE